MRIQKITKIIQEMLSRFIDYGPLVVDLTRWRRQLLEGWTPIPEVDAKHLAIYSITIILYDFSILKHPSFFIKSHDNRIEVAKDTGQCLAIYKELFRVCKFQARLRELVYID